VVTRRSPPRTCGNAATRRLLGRADLLEGAAHGAADPGQAGEQVLGRHVLVAERLGDQLGLADGVDELAREAGLRGARAARGRQLLDRANRRPAHVGRVGADRAQQRGSGRAALVEQRQQHVPRLHRGVPAATRVGDRSGDDIAALGGQTFGVHLLP